MFNTLLISSGSYRLVLGFRMWPCTVEVSGVSACPLFSLGFMGLAVLPSDDTSLKVQRCFIQRLYFGFKNPSYSTSASCKTPVAHCHINVLLGAQMSRPELLGVRFGHLSPLVRVLGFIFTC